MRHLICGGLGLGLFATATSASADWQYTRWGMSPEEVVAASNGTLKLKVGGDKFGTVVEGTHRIGSDLILPASLRFKDNKLASVALSLKAPEHIREARSVLRRTYGQAIYYVRSDKDNPVETEEWRSEQTNQYIQFISMKFGPLPSTDYIYIQSLLKPGEGGL